MQDIHEVDSLQKSYAPVAVVSSAKAKLFRKFMNGIPHNVALGIELLDISDGQATMALPYNERIVGNPASGVIHGGAITSLMDACCGASVFMKLAAPRMIATLDLRIDYLKPAAPGQRVVALATCYKTTRQVAFVRCLAHHDDPGDPIAHAAGTFMLGSTG
jgi:uncharacterized protein (TIGR00369 family)